jgi:hypothetical protein
LSSCVADADCRSWQVCRSGHCVMSCGDGVCSGSDTCSNCPGDCGPCTGGTECTTDTDCVPAECCHPSSCVPLNQAPVCDGVACSTECAWFSMDCGQGYCACQGEECVAVLN